MASSKDTIYLFEDLENVLSSARLSKYVSLAQGRNAVDLYAFNLQLSQSFYIALHMLEIVLRNKISEVFCMQYGSDWYDCPHLLKLESQLRQLEEAKKNAHETVRKHSREVVYDDVVAHLTFGFWTAMFSTKYENMWKEVLNVIARKENGKGLKRQEISYKLDAIRILRNRIAHHESILEMKVGQCYGYIMQLLAWMSPAAAKFTMQYSHFPEVYEMGKTNDLLPQHDKPAI